MAALTTIALVAGTAIAAGSYATQRKQAKEAKSAAKDARISDNLTAQANAEAAASAIRRDQAATAAEQASQEQADNLAKEVDVTTDSDENSNVRRRRVQAQFNVAAGGASDSSGSIRL